MTVTAKYMQTKIDEIMVRIECPIRYIKSRATRYASYQYENGAAKQLIWLGDGASDFIILCFYSKRELTEYINNGYELYINFRANHGCEWELDIKKI